MSEPESTNARALIERVRDEIARLAEAGTPITAVAVLGLIEACEALEARERDEAPDGTDAAHPAWWRGSDHGADQALRAVLGFLSGERKGIGAWPLAKEVEAKLRAQPGLDAPAGGGE